MTGPHYTLFTHKSVPVIFEPSCIREFLLGRTQRVRLGGQLSEEVRVTSGVPQGSVLGPLLFLAYLNDICRNSVSTIRLFADDYVVYKKIINNEDNETFQKDLNRQGE
jgi:hypothetical protein